MALIAGVDEAGRGCVIGALVLCAFAVEEDRHHELHAAGARDSKVMTQEARNKAKPLLEAKGTALCEMISAVEITELMTKRVSLNEIEAISIGDVLNRLEKKAGPLSTVYIDSPDPVASTFERRIRKYYKGKAKLVCDHHAESKYPVVAAASVVAKVTRDAELEKVKKEVGEDFGSGYTHDPATIDFLKRNHNAEKVQRHLRHKWKTIKNLKTTQVRLGEFL